MTDTEHAVDMFTVHNYAASSSSPSAILDIGRCLIHQATSTSGWFTVNPILNKTKTTSALGKNSFIFSKAVPDVHVKARDVVLREWNAPLDEGDAMGYGIKHLEEFKNSDFAFSLSRRDSVESEVASKPSPVVPRRVDVGSLYALIPQPHYHPPIQAPQAAPYPPRISPYIRSPPQPLKPFVEESMQAYLDNRYARSAWVVPVRGLLPWEGSSAGIISSEGKEDGVVIWTRVSLVAFWTFLETLKNANTLGPIALSFHAAPTVEEESFSDLIEAAANQKLKSVRTSKPVVMADGKVAGPEIYQASLKDVDHIKVYHDTGYAMFIRNVLDAWGWGSDKEGEDWGGANKSKTKRSRVLKGAKLVLVDARSKGVLIS